MLAQIIILASALSLAPQDSKPEDTRDLRDFVDEIIDDIESRDGRAFQAKWHKKATLYSSKFFFPFDRADVGSNVWYEIWADFFSRVEKIDFKETDFDFRRIGDVGIVWGSARIQIKRGVAEGPEESLRVTLSLIREGSFWKLLSWHDSPVPD